MTDPTIQFTAAKGTKFVRIKLVPTLHAVSGAQMSMYWRGDGKIGKDDPMPDRGKPQNAGTHDEARARLAAEAEALVADGHVIALVRGTLLPASIDFVLSVGGRLDAPLIHEVDAPVFTQHRDPRAAITDEEDRVLALLADAAGLDARSSKTGDNLLHVAVRAGSAALAAKALAAGVDPDVANAGGQSARALAELLGERAATVLASFSSGGAKPPLGAHDLLVAAQRCDVPALRACLAAGVPLDTAALIRAARALDPRKAEALQVLVEAGAKADYDVVDGALRGDPSYAVPAIRALIQAGARPDPSHFIESTEYDAETRRALISALIDAGVSLAPISLADAVSMSDPEAVASALARGESVDAPMSRSTYSLLHHAAVDGRLGERVSIPARLAIVEALLAAGASTDVKRVAASTGEQDQSPAYFPTLYALGGAPADKAPKKLLERSLEAGRKAELEAIVAAIARARKPKAKAARKAPTV